MGQRPARGFTLIEAMITVAILAILASVALPNYRDYVTRGRLVDATGALASGRARMEQYFQDNRTFKKVSDKIVPPCSTSETVNSWTVVCAAAPTDTEFAITATGSGATSGFVFSIDQNGSQITTGLPKGWGTVPAGGIACWVIRKGGTCG